MPQVVQADMAVTRATPQWFADVEALKPAADAAMRGIKYKPEHCESCTLVSFGY